MTQTICATYRLHFDDFKYAFDPIILHCTGRVQSLPSMHSKQMIVCKQPECGSIRNGRRGVLHTPSSSPATRNHLAQGCSEIEPGVKCALFIGVFPGDMSRYRYGVRVALLVL